MLQMLGRNLEALVTRAQELQKEWKDEFTSVEHLLLAMLDDQHFGQQLLRDEGLDARSLEKVIKEVRGSNRVTDQVSAEAGLGDELAAAGLSPSRRSGPATWSPTRSVLQVSRW